MWRNAPVNICKIKKLYIYDWNLVKNDKIYFIDAQNNLMCFNNQGEEGLIKVDTNMKVFIV